jgi:hypothetical protein
MIMLHLPLEGGESKESNRPPLQFGVWCWNIISLAIDVPEHRVREGKRDLTTRSPLRHKHQSEMQAFYLSGFKKIVFAQIPRKISQKRLPVTAASLLPLGSATVSN